MGCHKTFKPSVDNTFKECDIFLSSDCMYVENVDNIPLLGDLGIDPSGSVVIEALVKKIHELEQRIKTLETEFNAIV